MQETGFSAGPKALGSSVAEFVKENDGYYSKEFNKIQSATKFPWSWNTMAAVAGPFWGAARGLWGFFWIFMVLELLALVQIGKGLWGELGAGQMARIERLSINRDNMMEKYEAAKAAGEEGAAGILTRAENLQKVIDRLRGTNPASANRPPINDAPIVIVGTSRGTVSAANIALETKTNEVRGLILSASLVAADKSGAGLQNLRLEKLTVPLLFVHNRSDKCRVTPLGKVSRLVKKLERAGVDVQLRIVDSVKKSSGDCTGRSPHGFLGIEEQVIAIISTWIRKKVL